MQQLIRNLRHRPISEALIGLEGVDRGSEVVLELHHDT